MEVRMMGPEQVRSMLVHFTLPVLQQRLGDLAPLFHGLGFTAADIPFRRPWISWGDFTTFLERAARAVGGMETWEIASGEMVLRSALSRILAYTTRDARMIYVRLLENVARKAYRSLGASVEIPGEDRVRLTLAFPPGLPVNEAYLYCDLAGHRRVLTRRFCLCLRWRSTFAVARRSSLETKESRDG